MEPAVPAAESASPAAGEGPPAGSRRGWWIAAGAVAFVSYLPFLRGTLLGSAFFFRDLAISFFPVRLFMLEGLRHGELRDWNPYVHEGEPMILPPPIHYPFELLQLLRPDEVGLSIFLALHVSLAALAFLVLARLLGLRPLAAAGGALAYALGGFVLSTLNLYFHLLAAAWAPLVVAALMVAAERGGRWVPLAVGVVAVSLSTLGLETVLQTLVVGLLLSAWPVSRARWGRLAQVLALAAGLTAMLVLLGTSPPEGSARRLGFTTDVVLAHSVHPLTLLQVLIGGFHGDLSDVANRWWGHNFFPLGFPNILSLYIGALGLATAWVGVRHGGPLRKRLAVAALVAVVLALGRWIGLATLVDLLPIKPSRYPIKAFFTVHLCVAVLSAMGIGALLTGARAARRAFTAAALVLGGLLVAMPLIPALAPGFTAWFVEGFFPPSFPDARVADGLGHMLGDAATGGALCLIAAAGAAVLGRREGGAAKAAAVVVALLAVDLLRTGAGLNPMVGPGFFRLSPEMTREAARLRERGRTFSCYFSASPTYGAALLGKMQAGAGHDTWTFAVAKETLNMDLGIAEGVSSAYSLDLKMLTPEWRVVSPRQAGCRELDAILPRIRSAGVVHVLSLDDLPHPELRLVNVVRPQRIAPLAIRVYELSDPVPLRELTVPGEVLSDERTTDRIEVAVRAEREGALVVRESFAAGWSATVDGAPVPIERTPEVHMRVPVPAGESRVVLEFAPPRRGLALAIMALAAAITLWLVWRAAPGRPPPPAPTA